MSTTRILAFAGSTRAGSFNKRLVKVAAAGAREAGADVTEIDLRDFPMPLYDGDLEAAGGLPEQAQRLRALFMSHHGLLISTPEYNSSTPGVLKNAIDWVSRPAAGEPELAGFIGKVAVLMSASPGRLGGLRSLLALRALLSSIRVLVLPDQFALAAAHEAFSDDGSLKDGRQQATAARLGRVLAETLHKLA
jgi:NAD(P)H-dependent FMN reductase